MENKEDRELYFYLKLTREFEDRVSKLHRQGKILGGVYSGRGQEAIVVGVCYGLRREDFIAPHSSGHGGFSRQRGRSQSPDGAALREKDRTLEGKRFFSPRRGSGTRRLRGDQHARLHPPGRHRRRAEI
ncbi:MAG: hypothetical protein MPW15_14110 [Candidatus Manganitrophus sp.]|nr:hypothetical protein [Candidatus Manganitrophus sp.]